MHLRATAARSDSQRVHSRLRKGQTFACLGTANTGASSVCVCVCVCVCMEIELFDLLVACFAAHSRKKTGLPIRGPSGVARVMVLRVRPFSGRTRISRGLGRTVGFGLESALVPNACSWCPGRSAERRQQPEEEGWL